MAPFCARVFPHELGHWLVIRASGRRGWLCVSPCAGVEMRLRSPSAFRKLAADSRCAGWSGGQSAGRPDGGRAWDGRCVLLCWAQSGAGPHSICRPLSNWTAAHPLVYPGAADLGGTGRTAAASALLRAGSGAGSRSAAAALAGEGKPHSAHYRGLAAGAACSQTMPRDTDGMKILLAIR